MPLKITFELIPRGREGEKRTVAVVDVENSNEHECKTDLELLADLDEYGIQGTAAAVQLARETDALYWEQEGNQRWE